jgi:hypothetical protein
MGAPKVAQPFPFFKETESNQRCCGCKGGNGRTGFGAPSEIPQVVGMDPAMMNTMPSSGYVNNGHHLIKTENTASVEMLKDPVVLGTGDLKGTHVPNTLEFQKARTRLNLDLLHKDRH